MNVNDMIDTILNFDLDVVLAGLNESIHPNKKHGPGRPDMCRINTFCDVVKQCGFLDLGCSGPAYTWTNRRFTSYPTFQRLDR